MTPLLLVISVLYFINNISFFKSIFISTEFSLGPSLSNFILVRIDTYNEVKNYMNCMLSIYLSVNDDFYPVLTFCNIYAYIYLYWELRKVA